MPVLCLLSLMAVPASSWAVGTVSPGFTGPGGDVSKPGSILGGGAVGFNDLEANGRTLEWKRQWSWNLMDGDSPRGWCESSNWKKGGVQVTLGDLKKTEVGDQLPRLTRFTDPRDGKTYSWDFVSLDHKPGDTTVKLSEPAAWAKTATCLSPIAAFGYGAKNSRFLSEDGDRPEKGDKKTPEQVLAYKYLSGDDYKGSVFKQVGYKNQYDIYSDFASNPNKSGRSCSPSDKLATGECSWSEQLRFHPDVGALLEEGASSVAVVRVWRECAHKYPSYKDVSLGGVLAPVAGEDGKGEYENGKDTCETEPILERVLPRMSGAQDSCPSPSKPFAGTWTWGGCGGARQNNFYAQLSGGTYRASGSRGDGAFGANGENPQTLAGPLFGICQKPMGGEQGLDGPTRYQKRWCNHPLLPSGRPSRNPTGKWDGENIKTNQNFQNRCRNGLIGARQDWTYTDYAGQLAQALGSNEKSGSASAGVSSAMSFASLKGSAEKSPVDPKKDAFAKLFSWWNPTFYSRLTTPLRAFGWEGLPENQVKLLGINKGVMEGDTPRLPTPASMGGADKAWPPSDAIKISMIKEGKDIEREKSKISTRDVRNITCLGMNEWMAMDWVVGTKGKARVVVHLQPIPNRLYAVQIVMVDQRESIISESLQFMGGPATGQLPRVDRSSAGECEDPRDNSRHPIGSPECDPPWCLDAAEYRAKVPNPKKHFYTPGTSPPDACRWTEQASKYALPPLSDTMQSFQPQTQLLGQAWKVPDTSGKNFGRLDAAASTKADDKPLEGTPTTDASGNPIQLDPNRGLWLPRALKVSIFNPEIWDCANRGRDEYKGSCLSDQAAGQKALYDKRHRIVAQSDQGTDTVTDKRFAMSSQHLVNDTPTNPGWIPGTRWLQAGLPLMYADDGSNLFYNSWAVGVNAPTRAPKEGEDLTQIARDVAAKYGKSYDSLSEDEKLVMLSRAYDLRRAQVDESRFATLLGEGRVLYKTATDTACVTVPGSLSDEDCSDAGSDVEVRWHRLTSDKCPSGAYRGRGSATPSWARNPFVSVAGAAPEACDPERSVGSGWKVSDAYKLPELPGGGSTVRTTELSSSFRIDGSKAAPAHLELDAPDIPKEQILGVDIWPREVYSDRANRLQAPGEGEAGESAVAPIYSTDKSTKSINFCTPIEPYYVDKLVSMKSLGLSTAAAKPLRTLTHFSSAWADDVLTNMLEFGKEPSEERKNYQADPGSQVTDRGYDTSGQRGKWYVLTNTPGYSRDTQRLYGSDTMGSDLGGSAWTPKETRIGRAMYVMFVEQSEERGWKVQRMSDGRMAVWIEDKQYQVPGQPEPRQFHPMWALRQAALENWWRSHPKTYGVDTYWSGYRTDWNDWQEIESGNPWWWNDKDDANGWDGLETDLGGRTTYTEEDEPNRKVVRKFLGADVGQCSDLDDAWPNARIADVADGLDNDNDKIVDNEFLRDDSTGKALAAPVLDPGDYVVSFRVAGPVRPPSGKSYVEWGIQGMFPSAKNNEWVNNFTLQQQDGTTAIYRLRPTG